MILLNTSLSTSTVAVFDVVGIDPNLQVKGVNLSLAVDTSKMAFVSVPGDSGSTSKLGLATTGGFGGGQKAFTASKLRNGAYEMASAIQGVGSSSVPSNQVLLRFALQIQGQPVEGVVTTLVGTSSGLLDANARLIPGTAPVVGRLEIRKS